ncbi:hypothetical protein [Leptospira bouyouniensis]|uniref:Lipoprotein n=1 Tax=Leptospira bouyouniensis TaxID=2484911 RepID=A0ABY2L594_9LEPT|nr:hypothetical protein [Leptospira bouyouniensis]TGK47298.1 hypothetical protein EHQ10_18515 [Leptospira bouyouniensis]
MKIRVFKFVIFLAFGLVFVCKSNEKSDVNSFSKNQSIQNELTSRGYDVEINIHKGIHSYVSAYSTTKVQSDDLKLICNLPNLTNIRFEGISLPAKFSVDINNCTLENLRNFRLDKVDLDQEFLKSFSRNGRFRGGIELSRASIFDQGLNYLSELKTLDNFGIRGPNEKFTDAGLCDFIHSGISIKRVYLFHLSLSDKAYGCLVDLHGVEHFGFKKIKGRTASDMKKLEDLYFKKNGRKVHVDVFEYDSP